MSQFVDRALLQLHDPAALTTLLKGAAAPPYPQFERLLDAVFASENATIDHIDDLTVLATLPVVLVPGKDRISATWTASQPAHALSDIRGELTRTGVGPWAHLLASIQIRVALAIDSGGVESVVMSSIEDIQSFADFESRFRYLDLQAFLATHKITTVEQLREAAQYVLAEVRLKQPPPFASQTPGSAYDVAIDLALLLQDEVDVMAGLMWAQQLWAAGCTHPPGTPSSVLGQTQRPFAAAVVFPRSGLGGSISAAAIDALYAKSKVLPLFVDPP
jgi:hypothetical protein